jgi:DNA-binding CsgD family transcriptional regulator
VRPTPHRPSALVDRRAERARLDRLIEDARSGTSGTLVVRGEAGVGKSALVDDVIERAAGCRLVRASGVESEMELPFAALHQLCGPLLGDLDRLPPPQREALGTAFGLRTGPPPDRFLVGLAVLTLLGEVAERQPLICLVDDAQWLDRASAPILGFVARRLGAESVAMIFAVRDPWETLDLAGLPEVMIGPLEEPDARELLATAIPGRVDESVRHRILAEARGNPLALLELPRAWSPAAFAGGFGLPDSVSVSERIEESFRRRLGPLPEDSRRLLLVAAAEPVGDPPLVRAAAEQLGIPIEAAEPAMATGLLDIGVEVRFRHPLVRSVVYRESPVSERRLVHGALAVATDPDLDPDRRVWHLAAAAAGPDEDVALELERSAGRAQARGGVAASAAFLRRAVELTDDPARRADRAVLAARASLQAGAVDAALVLLNTARSSATDEVQRAQVALLRGHATMATFGTDGPTLLMQAAERLAPVSLDLARQTYLLAWGGAVVAGQEDVGLEICRAVRALPESESPGALELVVDGVTRLTLDGPVTAIPVLQRAARACRDLPVTDVMQWGWAAVAASNAVWDDELERATLERHIGLLRDVGALAQLPILLSALGVAAARNGDFAGANVLIAEGTSVAAATGSPIAPYTALRIAALRGRETEAVAMISTVIDQAAAAGQGLAARQAQGAAAVLYNGLGRYEEAAAAARDAVANRLDYPSAMFGLPELVESAARLGDAAAAGEALGRLTEMTHGCGTDYALGIEARSRALLTDGAAAEELYREAIDRLGRTTVRPMLGRAHLVYGEWLRRAGRRVDAREQLRVADELFHDIGMEAFGERARRELLATGERVRKRSVETQDELTPQELQIARLAADGMTNGEIGAQLFLSRRTVEWHLRKVFAKLDIDSRHALARALQRAGRGAGAGPASGSAARTTTPGLDQ